MGEAEVPQSVAHPLIKRVTHGSRSVMCENAGQAVLPVIMATMTLTRVLVTLKGG